jgi:hypothetical protein
MIDAADFLRAPVTLEGTVPFQPLPVQHVIGFGQSQTARLFWSLVHAGQNRKPDGALVFDGILAGVGGSLGGCIVFTDDETPQQHPGLPALPIFYEYQPCPGHLPPDGKYITIQTQSDIGWAYADRNQTSRYRHYELAGIAHIPPDIIDLRLAGATRQNPVSFRPFFKAALRNLADWIVANRPPPDSTYVEGKMNSDGEFEFVTDADGNVKGGVRLPHMPAILDNGEPAGAPLGVYGGLEDSKDVFVWLGGTFEPFSNEELAKRYPDRDVYVERVSKAADALLAERFILEEDHDAYIKAAQRWRR